MPRYFFDTDDGESHARDQDGLELSDPWEARDMALAVLPDIARDVIPRGDRRRNIVSIVRDESGEVMYSARLSLSAEWKVEPPPR
jgi:hypothetical protein